MDPQLTPAYAARRRAQGKSPREIRRCVKRAIARQLFELLHRDDRAEVEVVRACSPGWPRLSARQHRQSVAAT
jgi:hypothetical protein